MHRIISLKLLVRAEKILFFDVRCLGAFKFHKFLEVDKRPIYTISCYLTNLLQ